jgi:hypothetical protein
MAERTPARVTNLDGYGNPPLDWTQAREALLNVPDRCTFFLGTTSPDGRPHAAGIGAVWFEDTLYLVSGPTTRKSRNLAANPACTISVGLTGIDLIIEGDATRVTDPATLDRVAAHYRSLGWPAEVAGDAFTAPYSAPSAGPPPWYLYTVTIRSVVGVGGTDPGGATRWHF